MEDIIKKYKKEQKIKTISIIVWSLSLALWFNIFLSTTNSWKYIKSSVINYNDVDKNTADLYLENSQNNIINIKSSALMNQVKNISFSVSYNPENIVLKDRFLKIDWWEILDVVNISWINTFIINFQNPINIKKNEIILKLILEKKSPQKIESINLSSSNFIDFQNNSFILSTSWIEF